MFFFFIEDEAGSDVLRVEGRGGVAAVAWSVGRVICDVTLIL